MVYDSIHGVCIRQWREDDIALYAELVGDPQVMRFIGSGKTRDAVAAENEIRRFQQELADRGWSRWAVSVGESGPLMGYVGFAQKQEGIDYGLRFLQKYWNTPYAYMATCIALKYGFENVGLKEAYCMHDVNHTRAVSFTKKVIRSEPVVLLTELGHYNKFSVTNDVYMTRDWPLNERRINRYAQHMKMELASSRVYEDVASIA